MKLWKCYEDFNMQKRKNEWVVKSFEAKEQPTRYMLLERHHAFRYRTFVRKEEAYTTESAALIATLDSLEESLKITKWKVLALEESLKAVKAL